MKTPPRHTLAAAVALAGLLLFGERAVAQQQNLFIWSWTSSTHAQAAAGAYQYGWYDVTENLSSSAGTNFLGAFFNGTKDLIAVTNVNMLGSSNPLVRTLAFQYRSGLSALEVDALDYDPSLAGPRGSAQTWITIEAYNAGPDVPLSIHFQLTPGELRLIDESAAGSTNALSAEIEFVISGGTPVLSPLWRWKSKLYGGRASPLNTVSTDSLLVDPQHVGSPATVLSSVGPTVMKTYGAFIGGIQLGLLLNKQTYRLTYSITAQATVGVDNEPGTSMGAYVRGGDPFELEAGNTSGFGAKVQILAGDQVIFPLSDVKLQISRVPGTSAVELRWPAVRTNAVLEATTTLPAADAWQTVTNVPSVSGTDYVLALPATDAARFFRIRWR